MMNRRQFLCATGLALGSAAVRAEGTKNEEIIDVHQHVNYSGRLNPQLVKHQDAMGIAKTVLLPSGTELSRASTHQGKSNGLAARIFGTAASAKLAAEHPGKFVFFCNEIPDLPETKERLEKWLKAGARGIGEQKFNVQCDSRAMQLIYEIARDYKVPVLIHIQHGMYNHGFERLHKMLEKYPTVNFIGHAQTWWGNIDKNHEQKVMYPKTKVTPGGITDRLLADYPNIYGDLSAGSGLNSMTRDLEHAEGFLERHQDKLLLGTDCNDAIGHGDKCSGSKAIATVRKLVPDAKVRAKIFSGNARRIIRFS